MKKVIILAAMALGVASPIWASGDSEDAAKMTDTADTAAINVAEADAAAGEEVYQSVCKNCHGPTAKGMASFPKLSDKDADYLASRLIAYKAEEKVGPNSALMYPVAQDLSDEDIANVVAYITTAFK